jgi:hypothetical protein
MYDGGKIIAGLVIFVGVFTSPFWFGMGKAPVKPEPKIDTPVIQQMAEKKCVESKEFMRAEHMKMLNDWRDSLRVAKRVYVGSDGKVHNISLQNTCMNCHSNKDKFCDECHKYLAVKPYCWDCHFIPERPGAAGAAATEGGAL